MLRIMFALSTLPSACAAALVASALLLAGCSNRTAMEPRDPQLAYAPLAQPIGPPRSLVFKQPAHRVAEATLPDVPPGYQPYYQTRNDRRPSVAYGYRIPVVESAYTRTIDRQRSFRGRIYNSTRETTYTQQQTILQR